MKYPRADCPACSRDTAVTPRTGHFCRHDPPERDPELRSCAGSYALHIPGPGDPGYRGGDQQELFTIDKED